jgi:hypothetical protein
MKCLLWYSSELRSRSLRHAECFRPEGRSKCAVCDPYHFYDIGTPYGVIEPDKLDALLGTMALPHLCHVQANSRIRCLSEFGSQ